MDQPTADFTHAVMYTNHFYRAAHQPSAGLSSMADDFIQALRVATAEAAHAYDEQRAEAIGTIEALDLACDVLYDADIERTPSTGFGGLAQVEHINIRFPDDSEATVIGSWYEDQVDLFNQRITDDAWECMTATRVSLNPWGNAGMRVFQILEDGNNASTPGLTEQQDDAVRLVELSLAS